MGKSTKRQRELLLICQPKEALALVCTAAEAGEILGGVTQERINQLCLAGDLVAKRPGRDWIISRRSAHDLAAAREGTAQPQPKITKRKSRRRGARRAR